MHEVKSFLDLFYCFSNICSICALMFEMLMCFVWLSVKMMFSSEWWVWLIIAIIDGFCLFHHNADFCLFDANIYFYIFLLILFLNIYPNKNLVRAPRYYIYENLSSFVQGKREIKISDSIESVFLCLCNVSLVIFHHLLNIGHLIIFKECDGVNSETRTHW